jgi:hypothetical protein
MTIGKRQLFEAGRLVCFRGRSSYTLAGQSPCHGAMKSPACGDWGFKDGRGLVGVRLRDAQNHNGQACARPLRSQCC